MPRPDIPLDNDTHPGWKNSVVEYLKDHDWNPNQNYPDRLITDSPRITRRFRWTTTKLLIVSGSVLLTSIGGFGFWHLHHRLTAENNHIRSYNPVEISPIPYRTGIP